MNTIELNVDLPTNTLHGIWPVNATTSLYLGSAPIDGDLTTAIREFNLPAAVAPGEWPDRLAAHRDICTRPEFAGVRNF